MKEKARYTNLAWGTNGTRNHTQDRQAGANVKQILQRIRVKTKTQDRHIATYRQRDVRRPAIIGVPIDWSLGKMDKLLYWCLTN